MCHEVALYRWLVQVLGWGVAALAGVLAYVAIAWRRAPVASDAPWYERARSIAWRVTGRTTIGMLAFVALWPLHCGSQVSLTTALGSAAVAFTPAALALRMLPGAPRRATASMTERLRSIAYGAAFQYSTWAALVVPMLLTETLGARAAFVPSAGVVALVVAWQFVADRLAPRGRTWAPWSEALARAAESLGVETPTGGVIPVLTPNVLVWGNGRANLTEALARVCDDDPLALEGAARVALGLRRRWQRTRSAVVAAALGTFAITPALQAFSGRDARAVGLTGAALAAGIVVWRLRRSSRALVDAAARAPVPVRRFQLQLARSMGTPVVYDPTAATKGPYDALVEAGAPPEFPRPEPPMRFDVAAWGVAMSVAAATFTALSFVVR